MAEIKMVPEAGNINLSNKRDVSLKIQRESVLKPDENYINQRNNHVKSEILTSIIKRFPAQQFDLGTALNKLIKSMSDVFILSGKNSSFINNVISETVFSFGGEKGAATLEEAVKNSGLFLEHYMKEFDGSKQQKSILENNLKTKLLKLIESINLFVSKNKKNSKTHINTLKENIENVIAQIESNQSMNCLSKEHGKNQIIQVPFQMQDGLNTLKIYSKGENKSNKKRSKKGKNIAIVLELKNIDKVRIDILKKEVELSVNIIVKDEKIMDEFNKSLEALKEKLKLTGYNPRIKCEVNSSDNNTETLEENVLASEGYNLLDLKV